jgi:hypothetical protein
MLSDLDCAKLCNALYNDPSFAWDDILQPESDEGICLGIKLIDGVRYVVDRGSETPQDWWRDFKSELWRTLPGYEPLGDVAYGFSEGMVDLFSNKLKPIIAEPWVAVGHSLGAARAQLSAGMGKALDSPPLRVVCFGPPRVGMMTFCSYVQGIPWMLYRNLEDPVADVPTSPPFYHVKPFIPLNAAPAPDDSWGILADHHIELYIQGLENLSSASTAMGTR